MPVQRLAQQLGQDGVGNWGFSRGGLGRSRRHEHQGRDQAQRRAHGNSGSGKETAVHSCERTGLRSVPDQIRNVFSRARCRPRSGSRPPPAAGEPEGPGHPKHWAQVAGSGRGSVRRSPWGRRAASAATVIVGFEAGIARRSPVAFGLRAGAAVLGARGHAAAAGLVGLRLDRRAPSPRPRCPGAARRPGWRAESSARRNLRMLTIIRPSTPVATGNP